MYEKKEYLLTGLSISDGIAAGNSYVLKHIELAPLLDHPLPFNNITEEKQRIEKAFSQTKEQLDEICRNARERMDNDLAAIFTTHQMLLNEEQFSNTVITAVERDAKNAEYVIAHEIKKIEESFLHIDNEITRARLSDIRDIYHRLLRNMLGIEHVRLNPMKLIKQPVIIVVEWLNPSDIIQIDASKILGLVLETGSKTSHVSLIINSLGIPAVIQALEASHLIRMNDYIIIDAFAGKIMVNPSPSLKEEYRKKSTAIKEKRAAAPVAVNKKICKTIDNIRIHIEANASSIQETRCALQESAEGIGLVRSEFFYMSCKTMPTVEEEVYFYKSIIELMQGMPITIRLLDLGADKKPLYLHFHDELSPPLGMRGIRYLLKHQDLFRRQVSCICKAAEGKKVRILLPFVTVYDDLIDSLAVIHEVWQEHNVSSDNAAVGMMVEIPSAAYTLELFLPHLQFISIGTNDLIQYFFAASRENEQVQHYCHPFNPAILLFLHEIIKKAEAHACDLTVCGEMAADPLYAAILVGLGARKISMKPEAIQAVRTKILMLNCSAAKEKISRIITCKTRSECEALLPF